MGNIKKRNKLRNYFIAFISLIICICLAGAGYLYNFLSNLSMSKGQNNSQIKPISAKKNEPINILVMGVDIGTPGAKSEDNSKRTDTIMLMNYNPKNSDINIISIPRDTLIEINNKNRKINEAHALGGVGYLIDATEKLLDVKINYFSKLDYEGFRKVIDTIGPIEMKINRKMDYDDNAQNLHIHFNKGETVKLDGKKAEEFFRWRKNNDGTGLALGDLDRIENQHLFVQKVIEKFKSPTILAKMPAIFSTVSKYVETNMRAEDIAKYGYLFAKIDKNNISMSTLKGDAEYIQGISYVVYDEKQNTDILNKLHVNSSIK